MGECYEAILAQHASGRDVTSASRVLHVGANHHATSSMVFSNTPAVTDYGSRAGIVRAECVNPESVHQILLQN